MSVSQSEQAYRAGFGAPGHRPSVRPRRRHRRARSAVRAGQPGPRGVNGNGRRRTARPAAYADASRPAVRARPRVASRSTAHARSG